MTVPQVREIERSRPPAPPTEPARPSPVAGAARRAIPVLIAAAALVGLVIVVNPRALASALQRFNPVVIPIVLAFSVGWYVFQGVRWHLLLRTVGANLRLTDSLLLNMAGQTITAILPLGDLTRAIFAAEATGIEFGTAAATVTVQELTFILYVVLLATPGMAAQHVGGAIGAVGLVLVAIFAILTVPQLFAFVRGAAARLPLPRRLLEQLDELHEGTVVLLRRRETLLWSVLDLGRAMVSATLLWTIVQGLQPGALSWFVAALIGAVAYIGGAISMLPGGTGASDATVVGLLVLIGVEPGAAVAAALLQRVAVTGVATGLGLIAYLVARRRLHLGGLLGRTA
jgi:glycosyltransferase 2 family protein